MGGIRATAGVVPIVDFGAWLDGEETAKKIAADELLSALRDVGFVMLRGFQSRKTVTGEQVEEAFSQTQEFFALPQEEKNSLAWDGPHTNRGYMGTGSEQLTLSSDADQIASERLRAPDLKESMNIAREMTEDHMGPIQFTQIIGQLGRHVSRRAWRVPCVLARASPKLTVVPQNNFFVSCHDLHIEILHALSFALGLEQTFFDQPMDTFAHNLRLLNYPSCTATAASQTSRAGAHSDYGSMTLLFQDMVGGLEVQDKEGSFVPVTPVADTVIVNVGDLLQRWTNDVLKSTVHRVVLPLVADGEMTPRRNSIAFFCIPPMDQLVACIPNVGEAKHAPIECGAYLRQRLSETVKR